MRWTWVAAAVVLAFAAGWLGRGCAGGDAPARDAATSATTQATEPPTRLDLETTSERTAGPAKPEPTSVHARGARATSDAAGGDADSPQPASAQGATPANVDAKPLRRVAGVVVDSTTGEGLKDVSVQLRALREDRTPDGSSMGTRTDSSGRFEFVQLMDWIVHARHLGICAGRDGWRIANVPVETENVRIELERDTTPPRPGRIVGTAWAEDGKPLTGRLFVCIRDDIGLHSPGIWTIADANGRFVLDGVPPGHWTVQLCEADARVDVNVSEGGDAPVELRADFADRATGAFAGEALTEAAYTAQRARFDAMLRIADESDEAQRAIGWGIQQLDYQWLRWAPGRDVAVKCPGASAGATVRLDHREGGGCEWRAAVADGKAAFPSIPYGKWRAVLVRPGEPDIATDVEVKAGDGAFTVELSASK